MTSDESEITICQTDGMGRIGGDPKEAAFESICGIIEKHTKFLSAYLPLHTSEVSAIINNGIKDIGVIDRKMDELLDLAGMDNRYLALFKRMCRYYYQIDPVAVVEYIGIFREVYDSDENDDGDGE
jgi:hypothetical protein